MYPNPSSNWVYIQSSSKPQNIEIYKMLGELLLSKERVLQDEKIVVSQFPQGEYFIKVTSEDYSVVEKIHIAR
ncbi:MULTISPECIES: T9SS type A sorting domain-containing protein [unclassified Lentimicrobium]|uniref:T9SS type A sorting domain-containing protein n=1 Tax=unclassified Lentimicrobium TaxID=2677434 RepID=UPI001557E4B0|nr:MULTISPECIES: T9SS type A sorting domain-containing protein [unclassified Lentimicrobium]NPD44387.1 T9SS type A sorting domain-containing protein [Lentimicrobium sp. S6]NPD84347.1 T9SS type A sorting domain-containing protein [Lentimicrobium sp. L6]